MQLSNVPPRIQVPFAVSGTKRTIPIPSQIGTTPGAASYTDGFPPLTMTPLAGGGIPPAGQDFNGVLYALSLIQQWQAAGGTWAYDATWSTANNGYPKGASLLRADGTGFWFNTTDNNTADPDGATPTGWVPLWQAGITAVTGLTNANVTLTSLQYGRAIITFAGTLTGNVQIILPAISGEQWLLVNNTTGAFSLTAKTAAGTGVAVAQGSSVSVWGDGTNIVTALAPGRLVGFQVISSTAVYNASAGVRSGIAEVQGAGGGGGGAASTGASQVSAGSGGGAGGYGRSYIPNIATINGTTATIGAAGVGSSGAAGTSGGNTTFAGVTASGGVGGTLGAVASNSVVQITGAAAGGLCTGGTLVNAQGGAGLYAFYASNPVSGQGGASVMGGAGAAAVAGLSSGGSGVGPGAGGSGGACTPSSGTAASGGQGVKGEVIVWEFA